jgi:hypothetical protein
MKQFPQMAFQPVEWVDYHVKMYGHPPAMIQEMLQAMRNTGVPAEWVKTALEYNKSKLH